MFYLANKYFENVIVVAKNKKYNNLYLKSVVSSENDLTVLVSVAWEGHVLAWLHQCA